LSHACRRYLKKAGNGASSVEHVGLIITATYWFTSSTSFANPTVTLARGFTTTFAGIAIKHVPGFVVAQLIGAAIAAWVAIMLFSTAAQRPSNNSR
jgi:glycerol uptake facilitator-like aquaporin